MVVVLALTGVPAVRAAVADWFGFGGVRVRLDPGTPAPSAPGPSPTAPPSVPAVAAGSVAAAQEQVAFRVLVPAALGPPSGVEVSGDRRVVSMSWTVPGAGVVRLDQFDGELDYTFAKSAAGVEYTTVGGDFALWFDRPHEVRWLAAPAAAAALAPAAGRAHADLAGRRDDAAAGGRPRPRPGARDRGVRREPVSRRRCIGGMSGRLRVLGVLVLVAISVLAGRPAVAGGPTSVVLSEPGSGRMAALHASGTDYTALANYVGAFGTPGGSEASEKPSQSGPAITMTWLIHDVTPWRVDRVYLGGGEVWVATQTSAEGTGDLSSQTETWTQVPDRDGLLALLSKVGVNPLDAGTAASAPAVAPAEASAPAPVTAPAARQRRRTPTCRAGPGRWWAWWRAPC